MDQMKDRFLDFHLQVQLLQEYRWKMILEHHRREEHMCLDQYSYFNNIYEFFFSFNFLLLNKKLTFRDEH